MALQDDIDQKVTEDVQKHMGRIAYNNIILSAQVDALQEELARAYDQINTLQADRTPQSEPDKAYVEGEVVGDGETSGS